MNEANKYENPIEEIEIHDDFLIEDKWISVPIDDNWLDPAERYIKPKFTLSYNGVPFAPLGGVHGLTGQPGHGKTFTFTQLIVAILRGQFYGLKYELKHDIPEPKVLYIDTEMERSNTQLVMLRVYEMMGWEKHSVQEQFKILWLREVVSAEDRWRKVLRAIYDMKPTVVFLDGLIDVVGDFNDNKECQKIIYKCMATASHYKISMWCLLHENPGSSKMVGHAGSFLERKATDVLKTKKNKEGSVVSFEVSQAKARARDLDTWTFVIEDDDNHYGHPVIQGADNNNDDKEKEQPTKCEVTMSTLEESAALLDMKAVSFTTYRDRIKKHFSIGSSKASDIVHASVKFGLVICKDGKYSKSAEPLFDTNEADEAYQEAIAQMEADDIIDDIF